MVEWLGGGAATTTAETSSSFKTATKDGMIYGVLRRRLCSCGDGHGMRGGPTEAWRYSGMVSEGDRREGGGGLWLVVRAREDRGFEEGNACNASPVMKTTTTLKKRSHRLDKVLP
ncbi:hypothetical protein PIB30_063793 [Stylosanthes scabra]|uniref:Uncharacterized protein n=1 Tax=Stylosanthes scabra TaxID=79078 RepID=A0ABU6TM76_9FABA|nr:hypothetical protein [Stylosanthes scabra]